MNVDIKTLGFELPEEYDEIIDKKIRKIEFAQDMIIDLLGTINRDKALYNLAATINFRWGATHHLKVQDFDLRDGIDKLFDKVEAKVTKEKEKIKQR